MFSRILDRLVARTSPEEAVKAGRFILGIGIFIAGAFLAQHDFPPSQSKLKEAIGVPVVHVVGGLKRDARFSLDGIEFAYGRDAGGMADVDRWLDQRRHTVVLYATEKDLMGFLSYSDQTIWEVRSAHQAIRRCAEIVRSRNLDTLGGMAPGGGFALLGVGHLVYGVRRRR